MAIIQHSSWFWTMAVLPLAACASGEFHARPIGNLTGSVLPAGELVAEGRMHYRNGNFALAVGSFRKATRQAPQRPDAYNGLAASYDRLGRFDLAQRYYQEALALAPADPAIRHNLAVSLRMQGLSGDAARLEAETAALAGGIPAAATRPAQAPAPPPAKYGASVTIDLAPAAPQPAEPIRLKRMSGAEVALLTSRDSALARALGGRSATARISGTPMPISKVRQGGGSIEWRLEAAEEEVAAASTRLRVLNAVGRKGQAARMQRHLHSRGWQSTSIADAPVRQSVSTIRCPAESVSTARTLARGLGFPVRIQVLPHASEIVLVLGRDAVAFDDRLLNGTRPA